MAKSKTFSVSNMADGTVEDDTQIIFKVMSDACTIQNGIVSDPQSVTLAEKVFVRVSFIVSNDLDSEKEAEDSGWVQINSTNYATLSAGFLADLKKIFDKERTNQGLDPV